MNSGDKFHLAVATVLFIGLFSFMLLPPPLSDVGQVVQGVAFTTYKIARATGFVTDATMCSLADQWNFGGLVATTDGGVNVSCALLKEDKIALLPKERDIYGSELGGVVEKVWITDKLVVNKLFYVTYLILGLVAATVLTDIFLMIRGRQYAGMGGLAIMMTLSLSITMILARLGFLPELMGIFADLVVGQFVPGMFLLVMLMSLVWWVISQVSLGYHITKKSYGQMTAVRIGARADAERGRVAMEGAKKRR